MLECGKFRCLRNWYVRRRVPDGCVRLNLESAGDLLRTLSAAKVTGYRQCREK